MTAPRPVGDYYTDQLPWECDDCGGSEYSCDCSDEPELCPVCHTDASDICACDDVALVAVERLAPNAVIV